jgi:hypothetical protein
MKCVNLSKFPLNNIAQGQYNCIPATIHNMMRFHDHKYSLNQAEVLKILMINGVKGGEPSFPEAENQSSSLSSDFLIECKNETRGYDKWAGIIKKEIDDGYPVAISTRQGADSLHIRTVMGYDEIHEYFLLFDTQLNGFVAPTSVGWISGYSTYAYLDAETDYNKNNSAKDMLIVREKV